MTDNGDKFAFGTKKRSFKPHQRENTTSLAQLGYIGMNTFSNYFRINSCNFELDHHHHSHSHTQSTVQF